MKRCEFLGLLAVLLVVGCTKDDWVEKRASAVNRPRYVVYNTDGCDILFWPSNLPISVENFTGRRLKDVLGTRITTVAYCPQSSGFGHFTCRNAGEPLTGNVLHPDGGFYNAASDFFALGTDSLDMATRFCETNRLESFVSIRINDQHDGESRPGRMSALYPKFKLEHPECLMGSLDGSRNKDLNKWYAVWSCVDFDKELVRNRMKHFVRELVTNYDVDGVEYDFNRHFVLFRSVVTGGVAKASEIEKMTDLMRDLKTITEDVGRQKGRPIVIAIRMPDSVDYNLAVGCDMITWFREKLVDIWIGGGYFLLNPLPESVELAHRHGVKFYWSLDETRIPGCAQKKGLPILEGRMSMPFYAGRMSAAREAGCDGVYMFNTENGFLRRVVAIDPKDESIGKVYFATERGSGGYSPEHWLKGGMRFCRLPQIDPGEPRGMRAGESYSFEMFFGDDFATARKVEVEVLTNIRAGKLVVSANGMRLQERGVTDGRFVYAVSPLTLHRGRNSFVVTFPSVPQAGMTLNDFAVRIDQEG